MTWNRCQLRGDERDFVAQQIEAMRRISSISPEDVVEAFFGRFPWTQTELTPSMVVGFKRTYPEVRPAEPIYGPACVFA